MTWTSEKARAICDRILSFSKAARVRGLAPRWPRRVTPGSPPATSRRPAWRGPSGCTSPAARAGKSGSTTTDELDESLLREAVARSEALMAAAQPDPEQVEGLGPQTYPEIAAYDEATADAGPARRGDGVRAALDRGRALGLGAAGFFETAATCVGDRQQEGELRLPPVDQCRVLGHDAHADGTGSGYAWFASPRLGDVNARAIAGRAAAKAESSAHPRDLPPGAIPGDPRAGGRRRPADDRCSVDERPHRSTRGGASSRSPTAAAGSARRSSPTA